MKSDQIRKVEREQCCVLPNFSMTDYASQGKTQPYNPVDLQHSKSHQSHYTCLSCCASAKGTLIVQSVQPNVVTGGCLGWLRQEFQDLELLDEITKLAFYSQLPPEINGHSQNTLIRQFHAWKGLKMMHHLAANGMDIITAVHMMPYLQFCLIYGCQTLRSGGNFFKDSNQYLSTLHDSFQKY